MKKYILIGKEHSSLLQFAARELRRYLYVLGETLPEIVTRMPDDGFVMILSVKEKIAEAAWLRENNMPVLEGEAYWIHTLEQDAKRMLITGASDISVLYGVYHFLETLGIRFYLHGDVLPDQPVVELEKQTFQITGKPLFRLRGILPFHDFPEGPDWWNQEDYYVILAQLCKMRANFFGLHTYPENEKAPEAMTAEPLVWIGKKEDCGESGEVACSYPVQHFKTNGNSWGYHPMKTSEYLFGAGNVFEKDCYGADYMEGYEEDIYSEELHRGGVPQDKYNQMFQSCGEVLKNTFAYAKKMHVRTCIGTEVPLTVPGLVRERYHLDGEISRQDIEELYEGIFERIKSTHDLDYFWMWTPEDWTWLGNTPEETEKTIQDFSCAIEAKAKTEAPFELAVCGWTLGPQEDRAAFDKYLPKSMPFSCINRNVGFDPLEPKFTELQGRPAWAIPWMEDDPAMISPQLWAGRMRRDAYDAKRYGCEGLMGIHWRTKQIAPNVKALLQAAWEQPWAERMDEEMSLEGYLGVASYVEHYPDKTGVYATARKGAEGYSLKIPAGNYEISLFFQPEHARLDVKAKDRQARNVEISKENTQLVIPRLEVEQDTALDISIQVSEGEAALAAISIIGATKNNQLNGEKFVRRINCGGDALEDYEKDLPILGKEGRSAAAADFYLDFCRAEFGERAGRQAAEIFSGQDGRLHRPSRWEDGPGNIYCNEAPWEEIKEKYAFVDAFEDLESLVTGAANKSRFAYWKHTFRAMKNTAKIGCCWGEFERECGQENMSRAIEIYSTLLRDMQELNAHLLMGLETCGDMGVLSNIQQRSMCPILKKCRKMLEKQDLPLPRLEESSLEPLSRLVVPTVRTSFQAGEDFRIKVIVVGGCTNAPVLCYRPLGEEAFCTVPFKKEDRWVYRAVVNKDKIQRDFEYHILLQEQDKTLRFPQNDLHQEQTVVLVEG